MRNESKESSSSVVYLVDALRTPFLKAEGRVGPFSAADLAVNAGRALLAKQSFLPEEIDEVILGCVMPSASEANIARVVSLRLGCGKSVPAWTVQRNCASGLQAIDSAAKDIQLGRANLVLAGGVEAMSHAPLMYPSSMVDFMSSIHRAKTLPKKLLALLKFRPWFFKPVIALLKGLTDPVAGLNMGQTAEKLAYEFGISREVMDAFSVDSHHKAMAAKESGFFKRIAPLFDRFGKVYEFDTGVREDSSVERLQKLKPVFDKKFGTVTAGNSSQISDGAAMLLMASEQAVKKYELTVIGKIVDISWKGVDPTMMGLGPVHAVTDILDRNNLTFSDVDFVEINEAFAGQVLGCLEAWKDKKYLKEVLNIEKEIGELTIDKLNVDGGAIAIGHPVGASGARLVLQMTEILKRHGAKRGIISLCIGGGQGGAALIEAA